MGTNQAARTIGATGRKNLLPADRQEAWAMVEWYFDTMNAQGPECPSWYVDQAFAAKAEWDRRFA